MLELHYKLRTRAAAIIGCVALAASLLAGCGGAGEKMPSSSIEPTAPVSQEEGEKAADSGKERSFVDELGHPVVLEGEPTRIFAPYLEDSLLKLGVKPVVQWSNGSIGHEYLQDQLQDVPKLDMSGGLPSPEVLMSYSPDLIILHTASYAGNGVYENYAKIAPTFVFNNASGDIEQSLNTLGELLGLEDAAEQAVVQYRAKVEQVKQELGERIEGKNAVILRFAIKGISLMGGNYFGGYVLHKDLGLGTSKLVAGENSASVSLEMLPELDADYLFIINAYGQGTEAIKEMKASPIWETIPAVKQGHAYEIDKQYWLGGGLYAYELILDDIAQMLQQ